VPGSADNARFDLDAAYSVLFITSPTNQLATFGNGTVSFDLGNQTYTLSSVASTSLVVGATNLFGTFDAHLNLTSEGGALQDQNVSIGRGDFVIVRTGQMERCLKEGEWGGYAGGDAPGVKFENCYWCHEKEIAAICTDTWGCEVRPNETKDANQPWHWVVIPAMGLCMGEIFYLKELAEDCAKDKVYEFFFTGPPLIITGGTGSPINPQAIK